MIRVFPCSTNVVTKVAKIEGMITGVTLRFAAVVYEVTYFVNGEFKTTWMNEAEFDTSATKIKIGFNK